MKKIMSTIILATLMLLLLNPLGVLADRSISACYDNGVVTITGSGFNSSRQYTARVVDTAEKSIVAMENAVINPDGTLITTVNTGLLSGDIANDYIVYINGYNGVLAAQCSISSDSEGVLDISGVSLTYKVSDGIAIFNPTEGQINEIIARSGDSITIDLSALININGVDFYVGSTWFKNIDKVLVFKTNNGAFDIKTKTVWNNSGKTRLISVRDKVSVKNI